MKRQTLLERTILENPTFFIFIGILLAIIFARTYVAFGGNINLEVDGVVVHHFFIGIIFVIVSGLVFFAFNKDLTKNKYLMDLLAMAFGFGTGLIVDEANFLISTGEIYTLTQYYSVYNIIVELAVLAIIGIIFVASLVRGRAKL